MSFTYENQCSNTYLVYKFQELDEIDSVGIGMITNNKIVGLAQSVFTQIDKDKFVKYNVTSKVQVKQLLSGKVDKKIVLGLFNGIADAFMSTDEYMLNNNNILLDTDFIYTNVSSGETSLIYLPVNNRGKSAQSIEEILRLILFSLQFDPAENFEYIVKIINFLNSSKKFMFSEFKDLLNQIQLENNEMTQYGNSTNKFEKLEKNIGNSNILGEKHTNNAELNRHVQSLNSSMNVQLNTEKSSSFAVDNLSKNCELADPLPQKPVNGGSLSDQENISLFSLLAHYSKENKELYNYQKAVKKANKSKNSITNKKDVNSNKLQNVNYAVPGQAPQAMPKSALSQQNQQFMPKAAPSQQMPKAPQMSAQPMQQTPQMPVQPMQSQPKPVFSKSAPVANPSVPQNILQQMPVTGDFGETTVLGVGMAAGETTVLGAAQAQIVSPYLLRLKNNERIQLSKPVFRIGKERSYVDYFISDNTAVSRSHANILIKGTEFYIVDTNSTNHTYVNGNMLQSNVETKLEHGSKVRLANEEFEFFMY